MLESWSREASPQKPGSAPGEATGDLSPFLTVTPSTEKCAEMQLESSTTFSTKRNFRKARAHPLSFTDPLLKDLDSKPILLYSGCKRDPGKITPPF